MLSYLVFFLIVIAAFIVAAVLASINPVPLQSDLAIKQLQLSRDAD